MPSTQRGGIGCAAIMFVVILLLIAVGAAEIAARHH